MVRTNLPLQLILTQKIVFEKKFSFFDKKNNKINF